MLNIVIFLLFLYKINKGDLPKIEYIKGKSPLFIS